MLLRECSGFSNRASLEWDFIKHGIEFVVRDTISDSSESCYICFNPDEDSQSLSVRCVRAIRFVGAECNLTHSQAQHYFAFLDASFFRSEARIFDVLGGFLFRRVEDFRVVPTVSDHVNYLKGIFTSLSSVRVPSHKLVSRVFKSIDLASEKFRLVLGLFTLRDLLEVYTQDRREIPQDTQLSIEEAIALLVTWKKDLSFSIPLKESINMVLETIIPKVKSDLLAEWESLVLSMYNHRPPPDRKLNRKLGLTRSSERKARTRAKSYASMDLDDEFEEDIKATTQKSVLVVDNWLQCDKCSNWRLVDTEQLKRFESAFFQCSEIGKSCFDPAEDSQA